MKLANRRTSGLKPREPSNHPRATRKWRGGKTLFDSCKQEVDLIGRYLSSDLHGRELLAFEKHLAICPDCVAFLKTYKATIDLTRKILASQTQRNTTADLSLLPPAKQLNRR